MKCQNLFPGKNKKNILKCRLLKILLRVLSINHHFAYSCIHNHLILQYYCAICGIVLDKTFFQPKKY